MKTDLRALGWKIVNLIIFSIITILAKFISSTTHYFLTFIYSMGFACLFLNCLQYFKKQPLNIGNIKLYLIRGILNILGMTTWFYALILTNAAEAVAISFITPILAMIIAKIYLKEKILPSSLIAVMIGLFGALYIVHPHNMNINFGNILALISAIIWSIHDVVSKLQTKYEKLFSQTYFIFMITTFLSLPLHLWQLKIPPLNDLLVTPIMGLLFILNVFAIYKSYSMTNLVVVMPISFVRLIITSLLAFLCFGEIISSQTLIGSLIIVFASMIMVYSLIKARSV